MCTLDDAEVFSDTLTVSAGDVADGYRLGGEQIVPTAAGAGDLAGVEVAPGALYEVTLTGSTTQAELVDPGIRLAWWMILVAVIGFEGRKRARRQKAS